MQIIEYIERLLPHFPAFIYSLWLLVFPVFIWRTAKKHNLSWAGLIADSENKAVSRAGLMAWIIFIVVIGLCISNKNVPQALVEVFGISFVVLLGSKANVTYRQSLAQKKEEVKKELEEAKQESPAE